MTLELAAGTFGAPNCMGWQQVWMTFPVNQASLLETDEFIGVRLWNPPPAGMGG